MNLGVKNLKISYNSTTVVSDLSFEVMGGQFVAIVGPSGVGKTTILKALAGLIPVEEGKISYFGSDNPPQIGYVFQDHSVFPWRNVLNNVAYSLELKGIAKKERIREATLICAKVGLNETYLKKMPNELSGGERSRVALGMALASRAKLMLMDEPSSHLDFVKKKALQNTIQRLWMNEGFTCVLVTHDLEEAVFLADRVLMIFGIDQFRIEEINLPRPRTDSERYNLEATEYVKSIGADPGWVHSDQASSLLQSD